MLLKDLLVAVVIRRPEQVAGDATLVDDRIIALGRIDLDFRHLKEGGEIVAQRVLDGGLLRVERQVVGQRHEERGGFLGRRALGDGRPGALDDDDEAVVFLQHCLGDLEELESAA